MPQIPTFNARTDVGSARSNALMDVNGAASGALAAARAGETIANAGTQIEDKLARARKASALAGAQTEAMRRLGDLRLQFEQDQDFATQRDRYRVEAQKIYGQIGAGLDQDVRDLFQPDFQKMSFGNELDIARAARRGEQDKAIANLTTLMSDSAKQYGTAGNELQQQAITESLRKTVMDYAAAGWIDQTKAVELTQNWINDASREQLITLAMTNPGEVERRMQEHYGMPSGPVGFDANVQAVLQKEGGYVANDANAGETNFGINRTANPDVDVKNLTQQQAVDLYKTRYWDAIGADLLPPTAQAIAFDAAVNQGVGYAREMIARTGGDPQKMLADRAARYRETAAADPSKAQYLDAWLNRINSFQGGGGKNTDPILANLDPSEAFAVWRTASQTQRQRQQEAEQARNDQLSRFASDFEIGLSRGEKTYTDIEQAYKGGMINPVQRTRYTLAIDEQLKQTDQKQAMIARVDNAGQTAPLLDPANADDRKALNYHYSEQAKMWADLQPEEVVQKSINYAVDKGIVPEPMQGMVRGMLRGGNVQQRVLAADMVQRLRQSNPQLINDFADKDIALANSIALYTSLGMPPEQASQRAMAVDQMAPNEKAGLMDQYNVDIKAENTFTTASSLGNNRTWLQSQMPRYWWDKDPIASNQMAADFDQATQQAYLMTGNLDAARKTAYDMMQRVYGESQVNGTAEYVKFAPEKFFGQPSMSVAANAGWIREQLVQKLTENALYSEGFADSLRMTPYGFAAANGLPQYTITHADENGVVRIMTDSTGKPLLYQPEWRTSAEAKRQEEARQRMLNEARKRAAR